MVGIGDGKSSWENANAYCKSGIVGGVGLATMESRNVWVGVTKALRKEGMHTKIPCSNYGFWIGLKDKRKPQQNHKGDSAAFTWGYKMCTQYRKWGKAQPNDNHSKNKKDGQDCVQLWYRDNENGKYDDEYCTEAKGFVCQIKCKKCPCP